MCYYFTLLCYFGLKLSLKFSLKFRRAFMSGLCRLTVIWHFGHKHPLTTLRTKHTLLNCSFKHLHWLPVDMHIKFKIATLTYKILSAGQPTYLHHLLQQYIPLRSIRSASQQLLHIPPLRTNFSRRAFRHAAPTLWNEIPLTIRESGTLNTFKTHLKSHLFNNY